MAPECQYIGKIQGCLVFEQMSLISHPSFQSEVFKTSSFYPINQYIKRCKFKQFKVSLRLFATKLKNDSELGGFFVSFEMPKKTSRKIPKATSAAVLAQHFFQCAWCGINLTERHHIEEFHQGGGHTIDNLILLCPNCHTLVHKGAIPKEQLIIRKSTHIKGDRLAGNFNTTLNDLKVLIAGGIAINTPTLVAFNGEPLLRVYKENDVALIDAKFHNIHGALTFWMNRNMFWTTTKAQITSFGVDNLIVENNNKSIYLKFTKVGDSLEVNFNTYMRGTKLTFSETQADVFGQIMMANESKDCQVHLSIED